MVPGQVFDISQLRIRFPRLAGHVLHHQRRNQFAIAIREQFHRVQIECSLFRFLCIFHLRTGQYYRPTVTLAPDVEFGIERRPESTGTSCTFGIVFT